MKETKKEVRTQYIVQLKYRGKPDEWDGMCVTHNSRTGKLMYSLEEAQYEIKRIKREDAAKRRRGFSRTACGGLGVDIAHYSEYDVIGYRIKSREVTLYETIHEEVEE